LRIVVPVEHAYARGSMHIIEAAAIEVSVDVSEKLNTPVRQAPSRRAELITFLLLAFGVWPFVAVGVVGGYGLLVWIFQMIYGPPGPPDTPL
jgi:nitrate reductase NapE